MKAHFVTAALAMSLGISGTLIASGAPEVLAKSMMRTAKIKAPLGATAAAQWEGWLQNNMCPEVVTEFGVACVGADFRTVASVCVHYGDWDHNGSDEWEARSDVGKTGNWTPEE